MNDLQVISWIYLAIAISFESGAKNIEDISDAADYINHAIPTQKEMHNSIVWLISKNLIQKIGDKYCLTRHGEEIYLKTARQSRSLLDKWNILEEELLVI